MSVGPTNPPMLATELTSATPPAAARPVRNAVGSAQKGPSVPHTPSPRATARPPPRPASPARVRSARSPQRLPGPPPRRATDAHRSAILSSTLERVYVLLISQDRCLLGLKSIFFGQITLIMKLGLRWRERMLAWVKEGSAEHCYIQPSLPANTTGFNDTGLQVNHWYCYRVRAFNGGGNSSWSDTLSIRTH